MKNFLLKLRPYAISEAAAIFICSLSALVVGAQADTYGELVLPPLFPPRWVFSVVWTILFILMGISAAIVWKTGSPDRNDALFIYGTQLAVNFLWTVFNFGFGARLLAIFWLVFLILLVVLMTTRFAKASPAAERLQLPYLVWLLFAGYLSVSVYILNR